MKFITRLLLSVLGLLLIDHFVDGIVIDTFYIACIAAVILGLLNAVVRPVLIILTLPITIITLGLFSLVINAFLFWFAASFIEGFWVAGFLAAFLGSLSLSVINTIGSSWIK